MFEHLFAPIKIRDMELKNRIILPAMGTRMAAENGAVTDKLIAYHAARAKGGCALNIVEVAAVHTPSAPAHFVSISEDYLIEGENMTIIFQTGMLASREFEVKYYHEPKTIAGKEKAGKRFEIVPQELDGITMPDGSTFTPQPGDTYAVFGIQLPDAYICDNPTKTGASWDMFKSFEQRGELFKKYVRDLMA